MKNTKPALIFLTLAFIVFGTFVPLSSTCGCLTQEMVDLGSVGQVESVLNLHYDQQGEYPSLEILNSELSKSLSLPSVANAWTPNPSVPGIYYKTTADGEGYVLDAYTKKKTLFGVPVLGKVFDETVN